jgi:group I intron endonuclease
MVTEKNHSVHARFAEMARMGCVYLLTNTKTGKQYVGQTVNYKQRMSNHKTNLKSGCKRISNSIKKHGWKAFKHEIIWEGDTSQMDAVEADEIKKRNTLHPRGYNLLPGGSDDSSVLSSLSWSRRARKKRQRKFKRLLEEKQSSMSSAEYEEYSKRALAVNVSQERNKARNASREAEVSNYVQRFGIELQVPTYRGPYKKRVGETEWHKRQASLKIDREARMATMSNEDARRHEITCFNIAKAKTKKPVEELAKFFSDSVCS